jgi:hypothetical protein
VRRRITAALIGLTAVLTAVPGLEAHAATAAAPAVRITFAYYDSPGRDDRSTRSLNAEYVTITNTSRRAVALKSWTLRDTSRHVYVFGRYTLAAGASVTVHTGSGNDTSRHRYQDRRAYVWNNDKDTALLRDAGGRNVDSCRWTRTGSGKIRC